MNHVQSIDFDFTSELHNQVIKNLVTSFGLDFLLLEDKKGGDVDTIHNVRKWQSGDTETHISDEFKYSYENRDEYRPIKKDEHGNTIFDINGKAKREDIYRSDNNYKSRGARDKHLHKDGQLYDKYRDDTMRQHENRQLDHVISAHEVHHDAGRHLAGADGIVLANQDSNLISTYYYINNIKREHSVEKFVNDIVPQKITSTKDHIDNIKTRLDRTPADSPENRHKRRELEVEINSAQQKIATLESIDKEKMLAADKVTRQNYDHQINVKYYTSSKFLTNTALASLNSGVRMGMREALGIVLAEVWFELKEQFPVIFHKNKQNFTLREFTADINHVLKNIWQRVTERFKDLLISFKGSAVGGILSSITNTLLNIFTTTGKTLGKFIREMWGTMVSVAKLVFFNPQKLELGDLTREVLRLISMGVSLSLGVVLNQYLTTVMTFPFGTEIAAFLSALATGIMTVGMTYFLDHSEIMQKIWHFLNQFKSHYKQTLEQFQAINAKLDTYLAELAKVEFNMNVDELQAFTDRLSVTNGEYERGLVLHAEMIKRNIDLPFEPGNSESTRSWLKTLC
ncbi:hypothetical protein [Aeromonas eucrenophila]|uniref:ATPase n=1 Tax=Aeromonas eucrenophila TaxID=649 RepID=A0ABW0YE34_9GAMM|nr:hypothetical protein [Aeromonas eucrenophila]